jgi:hypothetical protein
MPNPWLNVHKSMAAMNYFFSTMTNTVIFMTVMKKSLQGHFREVIHNNYTLNYFVYMYTQICDENALIWGFPRQMFRPPQVLKVDIYRHILVDDIGRHIRNI